MSDLIHGLNKIVSDLIHGLNKIVKSKIYECRIDLAPIKKDTLSYLITSEIIEQYELTKRKGKFND
jgi:hypothetical protein